VGKNGAKAESWRPNPDDDAGAGAALATLATPSQRSARCSSPQRHPLLPFPIPALQCTVASSGVPAFRSPRNAPTLTARLNSQHRSPLLSGVSRRRGHNPLSSLVEKEPSRALVSSHGHQHGEQRCAQAHFLGLPRPGCAHLLLPTLHCGLSHFLWVFLFFSTHILLWGCVVGDALSAWVGSTLALLGLGALGRVS
jgi:hypothetical protein